jgi:hypothetical protein
MISALRCPPSYQYLYIGSNLCIPVRLGAPGSVTMLGIDMTPESIPERPAVTRAAEQRRMYHLNFGKHKGKVLGECPESYVQFLVDNRSRFDSVRYPGLHRRLAIYKRARHPSATPSQCPSSHTGANAATGSCAGAACHRPVVGPRGRSASMASATASQETRPMSVRLPTLASTPTSTRPSTPASTPQPHCVEPRGQSIGAPPLPAPSPPTTPTRDPTASPPSSGWFSWVRKRSRADCDSTPTQSRVSPPPK